MCPGISPSTPALGEDILEHTATEPRWTALSEPIGKPAGPATNDSPALEPGQARIDTRPSLARPGQRYDLRDGPVPLEHYQGPARLHVLEVSREVVLQIRNLGGLHLTMLAMWPRRINGCHALQWSERALRISAGLRP